MVGKYRVITLCGSKRFKEDFMKEQKRLTLEGNIVISVGLFGHSGDNEVWEGMDEDTLTNTKIMLDDMHKRKIDMADEIFIVNPGGYYGDSTKSEIEYAKQCGKRVKYLVHPLLGKQVKINRCGAIRTITEVTDFEENTFGQGNFAINTDKGEYLYECEIEVLD